MLNQFEGFFAMYDTFSNPTSSSSFSTISSAASVIQKGPCSQQEQQQQEEGDASSSLFQHYGAAVGNDVPIIISGDNPNINNPADRRIQRAMRQSQLLNLVWSKLFFCWISIMLIGLLMALHSGCIPENSSKLTTRRNQSTSSRTRFISNPFRHHFDSDSSATTTITTRQQLKVTGFYWGSEDDETSTNNSTSFVWNDATPDRSRQGNSISRLQTMVANLFSGAHTQKTKQEEQNDPRSNKDNNSARLSSAYPESTSSSIMQPQLNPHSHYNNNRYSFSNAEEEAFSGTIANQQEQQQREQHLREQYTSFYEEPQPSPSLVAQENEAMLQQGRAAAAAAAKMKHPPSLQGQSTAKHRNDAASPSHQEHERIKEENESENENDSSNNNAERADEKTEDKNDTNYGPERAEDSITTEENPGRGLEQEEDEASAPNSMSSSSSSTPPKNPAVFGWTPAAFPNPLYNPIRCAIAYLPQFMDHPPPSSTANYLDTGAMISPMDIQSSAAAAAAAAAAVSQNDSNDQQQQQQQHSLHPLRLCDPDWVLGGSYLEQIAVAMNNFTSYFGKEHHEEMLSSLRHEGEERENSNRGRLPRLRSRQEQQHGNHWIVPWADLALATTRKMDLTAVLRDTSYYAYEDEDDMVNDAAQIFARGLHDAWWPTTEDQQQQQGAGNYSNPIMPIEDAVALADHGILIFLSIQDRVCFICTGPSITPVLPWWRLDHIITSMKPALREHDFGAALLEAISNLSDMLQAGPPSMMDRIHDFFSRFGVVILFATFTFLFGAWGEYRDRRKRFQFAEERSELKGVDREKACILQREYQTKQCPICLESFQSDKASLLDDGDGDEDDSAVEKKHNNKCGSSQDKSSSNNNVDKYGIPLLGADGKRIKILRCGHIFCETCWKSWVHSGCGNPCNCPVCRQDIGRAPRSAMTRRQGSQQQRSNDGGDDSNINSETNPLLGNGDVGNSGTGGASSPLGCTASRQQQNTSVWGSHPSYESVMQSRRLTSASTLLAAATSARLSTTLLSTAGLSSSSSLSHSLTNLSSYNNERNTNSSDSTTCSESAQNERQPLLRRPPP